MKKNILLLLINLMMVFPAFAGEVPANWKNWDAYPDVARIEASLVANHLIKGENIILVYAGYRKSEVICSSLFLPYNKVPPFGPGSQVRLPDISKDTFIFAY